MYASNNSNSYASACTATGGVSPQVTSAAQQLLSTNTVGANTQAFVYSSSGGTGSAVCHDSASGWVALVSLKSPVTASAGWCVDSTGAAKEETALAAAGTYPAGLSCP